MILRKVKLLKLIRFQYRQNHTFLIGDKALLTKTFSAEDVNTFAKISLDFNPLHVDPDYAKNTKFGKCIVHGVLIHGLISAVCSTKLFGPGAIYVSQDMKFVSPAFVGDSVTAEVEILEIRKALMRCSTTAFNTVSNQVIMKGEAKILVPKTNLPS